jgi:type VI secretion system secreted protein Hcp
MPSSAYLTIKDDQGSNMTGGSMVKGREGTIEVIQMSHEVNLPTDPHTGTPSGARTHGALVFVKAIDQSSPLLFKALTTAQTLTEATLRWYKRDAAGKEQEYFTETLENAHVTGVKTFMPDTKDLGKEQYLHQEEVSLVYEKITWKYVDGNIEHTDDWLKRD